VPKIFEVQMSSDQENSNGHIIAVIMRLSEILATVINFMNTLKNISRRLLKKFAITRLKKFAITRRSPLKY
jgi:ABC-type nitrate/sulfonate/bicarbonate transport system permease component